MTDFVLTLDRSADVLVDEQVGRTRYLTPEGFLYCEGVRIARVGPMLYRHDEVPDIEPSGPGMITITRDADVLFSGETLASFVGKPVTNGHPPAFVVPGTFRTYSVGTVLNPRQGDGVESDYLLVDMLITDQAAIDDVLSGKREVSPGYSAPREQVRPGLGRQIKIVGNHVALVDRGRGGPACAIQDQQPDDAAQHEEPAMAVKKRSAWDRLMTAFKANDETAFKEELEAAKDEAAEEGEKEEETKDDDESMGKVLTALNDMKTTMDGIAGALAKLATKDEDSEKKDDDEVKDEEKKEEEDDTSKTADSAPLRETFVDVRARAEILAPGINLPTFDAASPHKTTAGAMHDLRVRALKSAYGDEARKVNVIAVLGRRAADFDKMTADAAETLFNGASELAKAANRPGAIQRQTFPQGPMTPAKYAEMIKNRRKSA